MKTFRTILLLTAFMAALPTMGSTQEVLRVGIIGLDTSHVIAFTKEMNNQEASGYLARCRVVAAYPKGSPDIESSVKRVPMYTENINANPFGNTNH